MPSQLAYLHFKIGIYWLSKHTHWHVRQRLVCYVYKNKKQKQMNRKQNGRGGVEDTRLEAKAKDTKKIRGQGQPFRGQTLSRPRTGMLEAKDQGHSRKCFLQKKVLQKSFSGSLQFIGVARIFDWGGLNHKSHAMTSSKICLLALNQDFANGESLN